MLGRDPDKVSIRTAATLENVAALELIEAPGLVFSVPSQYQGLPRLTGNSRPSPAEECRADALCWAGGDVEHGHHSIEA